MSPIPPDDRRYADGAYPDTPDTPEGGTAGHTPRRPLTRRQRQVAGLAKKGLGTTEIADALEIGYEAAKMHVNAIADLLDNPKLLPPMRLVRQWAIAHFTPDEDIEP